MRLSGRLESAVFLDRDGVVNRALVVDNKPYSPKELKDVVILDGVSDAVALLIDNSFVPVVVTNQPDIARGFVTLETVLDINHAISLETGLQHFYVCGHDDQSECECRKPKIGLLQTAALELDLNLVSSYLVGDRWKDIKAGQDAGCTCFFINNNYLEKSPEPPFYEVDSLLDAVRAIIERAHGH